MVRTTFFQNINTFGVLSLHKFKLLLLSKNCIFAHFCVAGQNVECSAVCEKVFVLNGLYCRADFLTATMVYYKEPQGCCSFNLPQPGVPKTNKRATMYIFKLALLVKNGIFVHFFLLRVSGWSAVCEGIFVMHGMPCHVMISADGLQNSIFLSGCSASKLQSGWFRKTWHQKSSGYVVSIYLFLTDLTQSWPLVGPNCIIRRLCHSHMISMLL